MTFTISQQLALTDIEQQVINFTARTAWIGNDIVKMCVRNSQRMLGNFKLRNTFDVATISVAEDHRGKGLANAVFEIVERSVDPYKHIYVENVLSPSLRRMLQRRGYKTSKRNHTLPGARSMYLPRRALIKVRQCTECFGIYPSTSNCPHCQE